MNPSVKSPSRPPRRSRAEKQAETRRRLLEAAEEVFRERGFAGATVEDITERAGFSRGAFYSMRATASELATRYEHGQRWLFELWLECLAYAARHPEFASLPATFWRGNRALTAQTIESTYAQVGERPPIAAKHLATALTALDIGLAIQNLVDPEEVPLDLYPKLYDLLFGPLLPEGAPPSD